MDVIDPRTGARVARYEPTAWPEVEARLATAGAAARAWAATPIEVRAAHLVALAAALRAAAAPLAEAMAREMGKPVAQGRAEVEKCAWLCEHVAATGPAALARQPVATEARASFVAFRPLGVVLAVMPWNFPAWQVLRCAAPALLAGNVVVLKHASNVPGCAEAIARAFAAAGLPDGAFTSVRVDGAGAQRLIGHPAIAAVAVTGSVEAGRAVARAAGEHLKKCVLELGGSDAYVVLADADLALAATTCAAARMVNGGQSCIAAKRFVVERPVVAEFERRLIAALGAYRMGDPDDVATTLGPMARVDLRDQLHAQVRASVAAGAVLRLGGEPPDRPGAWYPPTVLADVRPGMPAFDEELFGPVAAIVPAADVADAVRLANATRFGLGGAVFTRDVARGTDLAERALEAGACFVNAQVRSDPRLPFGGVKDSGYGRELGEFGLREFVNVKTVWVAGEA
jgi:succinate-semialdehyde dehydrogenase/glutarate-semialdehyde dehydrogenase